MGGFYTNYTLRGTSQAAVASALAGRRAIVAPERSGCVVAFDQESDDQDMGCIAALASRMSGSLRCPVFVVVDHDDDVLWYQLYDNGELIDEYDSTPGYFDPAAKPSLPAGGNAERLAAAFGASDVDAIEAVLRKSSFGKGGYTFAHQRHRDLVRALGLPEFAVLKAYASFERGEYPVGISESQMLRPADPPPVENRQLKEDREYYEQLGSEDLARPCKHEGCCRGAVRFSALCKRHHFEMITHRECPFDN
jgi:hypothetical protein